MAPGGRASLPASQGSHAANVSARQEPRPPAQTCRFDVDGALILSLLLLLPGCSQAPAPIFGPQDPALAWPPAPAPARIRYVGQLASSADLKPPPKPFQALGDLLVGRAKPATLYGPRAVACTPDGQRVWVADPGGRCLHLLNLQNRSYKKIERLAGTPLLAPVGLGLGPDGSIYLCDAEAPAIYCLADLDGRLLRSLRLPEDVLRPVALSYRADAGELWVADVKAHDLKVLAPDGRLLRIIGRRGGGPGEFNFPCDLADDGKVMWVVDTGNARVQALQYTGEPVASFGRSGDAPGDLSLPKAVALDSAGHLYVVDARFENVQIFNPQGQLLLFFGEEGTGAGQFWLPSDVFLDRQDRIWVCDTYNGRIQVFEYVRVQQEVARPTSAPESVSEGNDVE